MCLCERVYINLSLMRYGNFVYCRWLNLLIAMSLIQLVIIKKPSNNHNEKIIYFLTCKCSFNAFSHSSSSFVPIMLLLFSTCFQSSLIHFLFFLAFFFKFFKCIFKCNQIIFQASYKSALETGKFTRFHKLYSMKYLEQ